LSPWLAIAPTGLFAVRRQQIRREVMLCATIVLAFLLFNAGYYLPLGGWSPGPRFLIPALPFATVLVALAPRAVRAPVGLLIAVSIVLLCVVTATMPLAPDLVHDPVGDLWLPHLIARDLVDTTAWLRWGLPGVQPPVVLALAAALALAALCATASAARALRWATCAGAGALAAVTLSLGTPIDPIGAWGAITGHA